MSTITADLHAHPHAAHAHHGSFLTTYVFSRDHKIIGIQFLFSTLIWFFVGGMLALGVRWQLAWPWSSMPILGKLLYTAEGGQIAPEAYTMLFTMHATVMIFMVIIPILAGAFGNFLIPLMIGADDMAFPTLNMLSYWFMWPAFICFGSSFFVGTGGPSSGWTSYAPLSLTSDAQAYWLIGLTCVGVSSMLSASHHNFMGYEFLKVGDTIPGTRFKIVKFTEKYLADKYGTNADVSELLLEHVETKEHLTLVKEKVAISPESVATFAYLWGERREFEVRKDQEFSLKPQEEIKYKLIDVQPTKAVIVNNQKPNEPIEIGLLGP